MPRRLRRLAALACLLGFAIPSAVRADPLTNALTDWSTLLPGLTSSLQADDSNLCNAGKDSCVAAVLAEMDSRLATLQASCSHNAMFAMLYDHITRSYYATVVSSPAFFNSNAFVNHEDAVFASYYFKAYDGYVTGNLAAVPQTWQIAFDAAAAHQVSGEGSILLGVNSHIRRDLPFVLYQIGLTEPGGVSLKPDHDKVNRILASAFASAIADAGAHLDPSVDPGFPAALSQWGYASLFQAVEAWREEAWRNASALATAPDAAARAAIGQQIEANAAASATAIRNATSYGPTADSSVRDGYCAAHQPPTAARIDAPGSAVAGGAAPVERPGVGRRRAGDPRHGAGPRHRANRTHRAHRRPRQRRRDQTPARSAHRSAVGPRGRR